MNINIPQLDVNIANPDYDNLMLNDSNNSNYSSVPVPMTPPPSMLRPNNETRIYKKSKWTPEEDDLLRKSVSTNGLSNWSLIAESVPGRSGKQCRERWINQLCPNLNKDNWTAQEDAILVQQQRLQGNAWSKIAQFLPGRSSNNVKNRWSWLTRHRATAGVSPKMMSILINPKHQFNQYQQMMMMNQLQQTAPAEMMFEMNAFNNHERCGSAGLTGLPALPNRTSFSQPIDLSTLNDFNIGISPTIDMTCDVDNFLGDDGMNFDINEDNNNINSGYVQPSGTNEINDFLSFDKW